MVKGLKFLLKTIALWFYFISAEIIMLALAFAFMFPANLLMVTGNFYNYGERLSEILPEFYDFLKNDVATIMKGAFILSFFLPLFFVKDEWKKANVRKALRLILLFSGITFISILPFTDEVHFVLSQIFQQISKIDEKSLLYLLFIALIVIYFHTITVFLGGKEYVEKTLGYLEKFKVDKIMIAVITIVLLVLLGLATAYLVKKAGG